MQCQRQCSYLRRKKKLTFNFSKWKIFVFQYLFFFFSLWQSGCKFTESLFCFLSWQLSQESGTSIAELTTEAAVILDEMGHNINMGAIRGFAFFLVKIFKQLYNHIYVNEDGIQKVKNRTVTLLFFFCLFFFLIFILHHINAHLFTYTDIDFSFHLFYS